MRLLSIFEGMGLSFYIAQVILWMGYEGGLTILLTKWLYD